ncbi:universal stress protein [Daejeonella sp.]|jgi:nucleotide-binding universal stress UspA family protein|uniref:universal stress protein n=1 Tax=Daejeonella sp. TaxID=2805397 RepID=UPI0037BED17A
MLKVLTTTDFSANSKAGIRFAIQLASQQACEITFFHSYHIMKPSIWDAKRFTSYEKSETVKIKNKLEKFVAAIYKALDTKPEKVHYVISCSFVIDSNIIKYTTDHQFDLICISRRGEGKLKKIFGTNTTNLIQRSKVPVIAIPNNYKSMKIKSVLYASDLANLKHEMDKVIAFAKPLGATIELLHLNYPSDTSDNMKAIEDVIKHYPKTNITYRLENIDLIYNLVSNLEHVIKKTKPSILVMFTDQDLGFFEKLFLSSSTAEFSLIASVPLLVFKKN